MTPHRPVFWGLFFPLFFVLLIVSFVGRYDDEHVVEVASSGRVTAGFWACIAADGGALALAETPEHMNRFGYINILETTMLPAVRPLRPEGIRLMQDNAPIHNAGDTREFLRDAGVDVINWPPYSPDLNPIENVWGMMVREWDSRREATREALAAHVQEVWGTWQRRGGLVTQLVDSMPRRLQAVIDAQGGHTKY